MEINSLKRAYSSQMQKLETRRKTLRNALQAQDGGIPQAFDRVELSAELKQINTECDWLHKLMEDITATEAAIQNSETSGKQFEALTKQAKMLSKMLEIYRRIASGGRVPPQDENALMNYSQELYLAAKMEAAVKKQKDRKEYDSVLEEEESSDSKEGANHGESVEGTVTQSESVDIGTTEGSVNVEA